MYSYLLRRIGVAAVTFIFSTILVFMIIQLPPGDFVDYILSRTSSGGGGAEGYAEDLREYYGLNKPLYQRYLKWVGGIFRGDLGYSMVYRQPVVDLIKREIAWTLVVTGLSFAFAWSMGVILGIYSATHKYSLGDFFLTVFGFLGLSIPNFFLAMLILFVLMSFGTGITGGLFSTTYTTAPWSWAKFTDLLKHIWIPVVAIGTQRIAAIMRLMRGNLLEELNKPYIQTAKAKGLKNWQVVIKHGVRMAVNPLISLAGTLAPKLISGIVVTAVVLNLPVMGPTFIEALKAQDMFLAGAYLLVILVFLLIGNILADIALAITDPRIRY